MTDGYKIKRVLTWVNGVEKQIYPAVSLDYLCFTANAVGVIIRLNKNGSPTEVTLETSTDGTTWSTYTIGDNITLSNIGDKVYFRNTSTTTTGFSTSASAYYSFYITGGNVNCDGDITYLLNKNGTDTLTSNYCFSSLFSSATALVTAPSLPATTLTQYCYINMFNGCTNLEQIPQLPATTLAYSCYYQMFNGCSKIKLSTTQTGEYQTAYRIPTTGTGTTASYALTNMFKSTGGTFTGTPSINTTYYTSNTVV